MIGLCALGLSILAAVAIGAFSVPLPTVVGVLACSASTTLSGADNHLGRF
jgi:maltodextrin utilization protein YvdJ